MVGMAIGLHKPPGIPGSAGPRLALQIRRKLPDLRQGREESAVPCPSCTLD